MQEMAVLGTKKHYLHCISILHFDMYGNVTLPHALELYDWGYFDLKPVVIFPMTTPIILFELSKKGRKSVSKYRKIWDEIYVPGFELESADIQNEYDMKSGRENGLWGFSESFFEQEKANGNHQKILRLCPNMAQIEAAFGSVAEA